MSMTTVVIVVVAVVAIVALVLLARDGGPRITTIEHRHDEKDEPEDRDQ